jgi:hypothetical protein
VTNLMCNGGDQWSVPSREGAGCWVSSVAVCREAPAVGEPHSKVGRARWVVPLSTPSQNAHGSNKRGKQKHHVAMLRCSTGPLDQFTMARRTWEC